MLNLAGQNDHSNALCFERKLIASFEFAKLVADSFADRLSLAKHAVGFVIANFQWIKNSMSNLELLLQNARLRDEIEPYMDESVYLVDLDRMTVDHENEFLQSLLEWERAPVLPISNWFEPALTLPAHHELDDDQLQPMLYEAICRLYEKNILLEYTSHLSDRQLYCLIARDILPAQEKRVLLNGTFLRWQCIDIVEDDESWLRFYATDDERQAWQSETGLKLPPREEPPFKRNLPQNK